MRNGSVIFSMRCQFSLQITGCALNFHSLCQTLAVMFPKLSTNKFKRRERQENRKMKIDRVMRRQMHDEDHSQNTLPYNPTLLDSVAVLCRLSKVSSGQQFLMDFLAI